MVDNLPAPVNPPPIPDCPRQDLLDFAALADACGPAIAGEVLRRRGWKAVEPDRAEELIRLILHERTRPKH